MAFMRALLAFVLIAALSRQSVYAARNIVALQGAVFCLPFQIHSCLCSSTRSGSSHPPYHFHFHWLKRKLFPFVQHNLAPCTLHLRPFKKLLCVCSGQLDVLISDFFEEDGKAGGGGSSSTLYSLKSDDDSSRVTLDFSALGEPRGLYSGVRLLAQGTLNGSVMLMANYTVVANGNQQGPSIPVD
jgi:hypothetical protein